MADGTLVQLARRLGVIQLDPARKAAEDAELRTSGLVPAGLGRQACVSACQRSSACGARAGWSRRCAGAQHVCRRDEVARIAGREEAGLHEELERVLVIAALVEPEPTLVQLVHVHHRVLRKAVDAVHLRGAAQAQCGGDGAARRGWAVHARPHACPLRWTPSFLRSDHNLNERGVGAALFQGRCQCSRFGG